MFLFQYCILYCPRSMVYKTNIDIIKLLSAGLKLVSAENEKQASPNKGGK